MYPLCYISLRSIFWQSAVSWISFTQSAVMYLFCLKSEGRWLVAVVVAVVWHEYKMTSRNELCRSGKHPTRRVHLSLLHIPPQDTLLSWRAVAWADRKHVCMCLWRDTEFPQRGFLRSGCSQVQANCMTTPCFTVLFFLRVLWIDGFCFTTSAGFLWVHNLENAAFHSPMHLHKTSI